MNHAIPLKAAEAVASGRLSVHEVIEILNSLDYHRRSGTLRKRPGAYFLGAIKKAFARNGMAW